VVWQRESTIEFDYTVHGVLEENDVCELVRVDQVVIDESSAGSSSGRP
jgi:hypothetical protein